MLTFTIAHLSVDRAALPRAGPHARLPRPAVVARSASGTRAAARAARRRRSPCRGLDQRARAARGRALRGGRAGWLGGLALYVVYRRSQGKSLTQALHDPRHRASRDAPRSSTGASSCRCSASRWTTTSWAPPAGSRPRTATRARAAPCWRRSTCSRSRCRCRSTRACRTSASPRRKRVLARAKEVGEEYEGVEVATAMVRGRTVGAGDRGRGPPARGRGDRAGGRGAHARARRRDPRRPRRPPRPLRRARSPATWWRRRPARVILTAPPAGEDGVREGVRRRSHGTVPQTSDRPAAWSAIAAL